MPTGASPVDHVTVQTKPGRALQRVVDRSEARPTAARVQAARRPPSRHALGRPPRRPAAHVGEPDDRSEAALALVARGRLDRTPTAGAEHVPATQFRQALRPRKARMNAGYTGRMEERETSVREYVDVLRRRRRHPRAHRPPRSARHLPLLADAAGALRRLGRRAAPQPGPRLQPLRHHQSRRRRPASG